MRDLVRKRKPVFVTTLVVMFCLLAFAAPVRSARNQQSRTQAPPRLPAPKSSISQAAKSHTRDAVAAVGLVLVRNTGQPGEPRPRGSAVIIRADGLVVTNYHVVAQDKVDRLFDEIYLSLADESATSSGTKRYRLKGAQMNPEQDLALLRIVADAQGQPVAQPANFTALGLGDARSLKLLDTIIIIGYPEKGGTTVTISTGAVQGKDTVDHWIKTDAQLIRGNSGGAAINEAGRLIGIPTKVVFDTKLIDKTVQQIGGVGFLRPAYLLAGMIERMNREDRSSAASTGTTISPTSSSIILRGIIRAVGGRPVAGARVGLMPVGTATATAENLLAWGGTNADGQFELNKGVTAGRYTLKVKAVGYEAFSRDVDIKPGAAQINVELRALR